MKIYLLHNLACTLHSDISTKQMNYKMKDIKPTFNTHRTQDKSQRGWANLLA